MQRKLKIYCHHFDRKLWNKILISLLSPMLNNHSGVFFRSPSWSFQWFHLRRCSFPSLKKDNKQKHKLFLRDNCIFKLNKFSWYQVKQRDHGSYETAARKDHTNFCKKYFLALRWNVSFNWSQNYVYLVYGRSCVQLRKENIERKVELNFRKAEIVLFGEEQNIKTDTHH